MEKKKCENGITLIALVISTVILLILSGVTIVTLSGDNGILKIALEAKKKSEESQEKEELELAIGEVKLDYEIER